MAAYAKAQSEGVTYIKYDTALRKHIKPKLGGCFPMGMTTGLIDDFNGKKEMRVLSREEQTRFVFFLRT